MNKFYTYKFDNFNYTDYLIRIPEHSVFYRGVRNKSRLGDVDILRKNMPIYLSSKESAQRYSDNVDDNLYHIALKREMKVLDIRKIQSLLQMIMDTNSYYNNPEFRYHMGVFSVVLGLVDYRMQIDEFIKILHREKFTIDEHLIQGINRMKQFLTNSVDTFRFPRGPFTKIGVRIGITELDAQMVLFLKELLSGICDGYIAPKMLSPLQPDFHINEELVLFDTSTLEIIDKTKAVETQHIEMLLGDYNGLHNLIYKAINFKAYMFELGGGGYAHEDKNEFFCDKIKVRKASKIAKRLVKKILTKPKQTKAEPRYEDCVGLSSYSAAFVLKKQDETDRRFDKFSVNLY